MLRPTGVLAGFLLYVSVTAQAQEIRPGVWAAITPETLPLPVQGYRVYLVGEYHGLAENEEFQIRYLTRLHKASGLRDVAIEEDAVYEPAAQAFVEGRATTLRYDLCLRAGILHRIRQFNTEHPDSKIRVHLTDVDSPADAIREHLLVLKNRIAGAANIQLPPQNEIKEHGLEVVAKLKQFEMDAKTRSELRTVEHSVHVLQDGLEVGTLQAKGSPYLEDREQAVTSNILDLINTGPLLVLYGADHVSRKRRNDGGPKRDQPFPPVALRLEQAGVKAFSLVMFPLAGQSLWRGHREDLLWTANDGHLASGETFDKVLAKPPEVKYLYIDPKRERARLPSEDVSNYAVDAFLLFRSSGPMKNYCTAR